MRGCGGVCGQTAGRRRVSGPDSGATATPPRRLPRSSGAAAGCIVGAGHWCAPPLCGRDGRQGRAAPVLPRRPSRPCSVDARLPSRPPLGHGCWHGTRRVRMRRAAPARSSAGTAGAPAAVVRWRPRLLSLSLSLSPHARTSPAALAVRLLRRAAGCEAAWSAFVQGAGGACLGRPLRSLSPGPSAKRPLSAAGPGQSWPVHPDSPCAPRSGQEEHRTPWPPPLPAAAVCDPSSGACPSAPVFQYRKLEERVLQGVSAAGQKHTGRGRGVSKVR